MIDKINYCSFNSGVLIARIMGDKLTINYDSISLSIILFHVDRLNNGINLNQQWSYYIRYAFTALKTIIARKPITLYIMEQFGNFGSQREASAILSNLNIYFIFNIISTLYTGMYLLRLKQNWSMTIFTERIYLNSFFNKEVHVHV